MAKQPNSPNDTPERGGAASPNAAAQVARWLDAIERAGDEERNWRQNAEAAIRRYRDDQVEDRPPSQFNILWSNTEILRSALYSSTPRPDVRRRFRDADPVAKAAAQALERALAFAIDDTDLDATMNLAILDYVLPGRAVTRVRYRPMFKAPADGADGPEEKVDERVVTEHVHWKRFRRGPGATWAEVEWIAYEHLLSRDELRAQFGAAAKQVKLDLAENEEEEGISEHARARVHEVWDKRRREILFIAPSARGGPLKVEKDKLGLRDFFDCPRPLYWVDSTDTLVPVDGFQAYRDQAEELDRITLRINRLIQGLKLRGIYDATLRELENVMDADDNELVPAENGLTVMQAAEGGLDRAIWMMPIERIAQVLSGLYTQREQLKNVIFEITGMSDILRGSTHPHETLGAQTIKTQSGSLRLRRRQREIQRYVRDLMCLQAEIAAEHFSAETLRLMTGLRLDAEGRLGAASWPAVMKLLRSAGAREFRIDVETDSTIAGDLLGEQQGMSRLLDGITGYVQAMGPAVEAGYVPVESAKAMLSATVRRFRLGREVEDAVDQIGEADGQGTLVPVAVAMAEVEARAQVRAQELAKSSIETAKLEASSAQAAADRDLKRELAEAQLRSSERVTREKMALERSLKNLDRGLPPDFSIDAQEEEMRELARALREMAAVNQQILVTLASLAQHMSAPKQVVRDESGRVAGLETVPIN